MLEIKCHTKKQLTERILYGKKRKAMINYGICIWETFFNMSKDLKQKQQKQNNNNPRGCIAQSKELDSGFRYNRVRILGLLFPDFMPFTCNF